MLVSSVSSNQRPWLLSDRLCLVSFDWFIAAAGQPHIDGPAIQYLTPNSTLELVCRLEQERTQLEWLHNDRPVVTGPSTGFSQMGKVDDSASSAVTMSFLRKDRIDAADFGTFTCRTFSGLGTNGLPPMQARIELKKLTAGTYQLAHTSEQ